MPNNLNPIKKVTLTSTSTAIELDGIPSTYQHLLIKGKVRGVDTGTTKDNARVRFNNDGSSNYRSQMGSIRGTTDIITSNTSGQTGGLFDLTCQGASGTTNVWTNIEILIPNYKSTTTRKTGVIKANTTATSGNQGNSITGFCNTGLDSTAINTVSIFISSSFAIGSELTLYGYSIS
jgi:hypothetical protein